MAKAKEKELTAAQRYLQLTSALPETIVDVKVPSGFLFRMVKPNTFALIMNTGLPQTATNEAAAEWEKAGVLALSEQKAQNDEEIGRKMFEIRDQTIALSRSPRIVIGEANPVADELSTAEINDGDLAYLFKWVAAGGSESLMLSMFPE